MYWSSQEIVETQGRGLIFHFYEGGRVWTWKLSKLWGSDQDVYGGKSWRISGYFRKDWVWVLVLALHLGWWELLSLPGTGKGFLHSLEIYDLLLGGKGEGQAPFLPLLLLNCPQLKIILMPEWHIWGGPFWSPSPWNKLSLSKQNETEEFLLCIVYGNETLNG